MAKLSTTERKSMPKSEFAGPGESFPINDKTHAQKAIQLAPRSEHAGNISKSTEKSIVAKGERKLHGSEGKSAFGSHREATRGARAHK